MSVTSHTPSMSQPGTDVAMTDAAPVERYPKRKRVAISYAPPEDSEDDWASEEEYEPQPKKTKRLPKVLPKHKIFPFL